MELDCQEQIEGSEDPRKEVLSALLFDLALFPNEPILCFDATAVEQQLKNLAAIYYEHVKEIDCIIGRLVNLDMKKLFQTGVYMDSRIKDFTIDGVYRVFNTGTSRSFSKEQASYGLYLIFLAVQSVFYQILGRKVMA